MHDFSYGWGGGVNERDFRAASAKQHYVDVIDFCWREKFGVLSIARATL